MKSSPPDAPVGSLSFDDGRIIRDVNRAGVELLGRSRAALVGQPLNVILPLAARIFFDAHLLPVLMLEGRVEAVYVSLRGPNDRPIPVLLDAKRIAHEGVTRNLCGFVSVRGRHLLERELAWVAGNLDEAMRGK
ncbi:MAG: PAS domain-containing protein [Polyangiaceae bacterium]|nr:PAS domain-containing protein [Polyangiaceae bacterium]